MYTYSLLSRHIYTCTASKYIFISIQGNIRKHIFMCTCPPTYESASSGCHQRSNHTDCLHLHDNDDDDNVNLNRFHT
jgi:hypothetical protein